MTSKYDGTRLEVCRTGGHERVTTSSNLGQGTAQACKGCFVNCPSTNGSSVCKMNIGGVASATIGIDIPHSAGTYRAGPPIFVPISNVSQLYFWSDDDGAFIDIVYLVG